MENASEALIMAGSVLIVIVALSITISSFSQLINTVDEITLKEEILDTATDDGELLRFYKADSEIRQVNASTVMTSIRRASSENYNVYVYSSKNDGDLYTFIDTYKDQYPNVFQKSAKEQLYKEETIITEDTNIMKVTLLGEGYKSLNNDVFKALYDVIKDSTFKEYLGEYQDAVGNDADKLTYRIITFVEE
jgi:hypothetical protein